VGNNEDSSSIHISKNDYHHHHQQQHHHHHEYEHEGTHRWKLLLKNRIGYCWDGVMNHQRGILYISNVMNEGSLHTKQYKVTIDLRIGLLQRSISVVIHSNEGNICYHSISFMMNILLLPFHHGR
jgi:hypothetical protein